MIRPLSRRRLGPRGARPGDDDGAVVYAYAIGVRSSRAIERRWHDDLAFRVITANRTPDHATIARFRLRHEEAIAALFGRVLALCARSGLAHKRSSTICVIEVTATG